MPSGRTAFDELLLPTLPLLLLLILFIVYVDKFGISSKTKVFFLRRVVHEASVRAVVKNVSFRVLHCIGIIVIIIVVEVVGLGKKLAEILIF